MSSKYWLLSLVSWLLAPTKSPSKVLTKLSVSGQLSLILSSLLHISDFAEECPGERRLLSLSFFKSLIRYSWTGYRQWNVFTADNEIFVGLPAWYFSCTELGWKCISSDEMKENLLNNLTNRYNHDSVKLHWLRCISYIFWQKLAKSKLDNKVIFQLDTTSSLCI